MLRTVFPSTVAFMTVKTSLSNFSPEKNLSHSKSCRCYSGKEVCADPLAAYELFDHSVVCTFGLYAADF